MAKKANSTFVWFGVAVGAYILYNWYQSGQAAPPVVPNSQQALSPTVLMPVVSPASAYSVLPTAAASLSG
jgi:hypothetical protein